MSQRSEEKHIPDAQDAAAAVRRARFGTLPERVRPEDRFVELPATPPDPARTLFNDDEWLVRTCA